MCGKCEQIIRNARAELDATVYRSFPCLDCGSTGTRHLAGSVVNGVFVGSSGVCYRCSGQGRQTMDDVRRNTYYDMHYRRISLT